MYDCYSSGYYQFCRSNDLQNFSWICNTATSGSFTPRHGTTIAITKEEAERLFSKWPSTGISATPMGSKSPQVRTDRVEINTTTKTIKLPVNYGTKLSAFDPMLYSYASIAEVSPSDRKSVV